jgi:cation/acetate symporter
VPGGGRHEETAVSSGNGQSLALMVFLAFVTVSLLLCGLAAADLDDPEHFYAGGSAAFGPVAAGLAICGDYVSAATLLSTTGAVALDGMDGILFACATVASLYLVMRVVGERLRGEGVFTLGDFVARRLGDLRAGRALAVATLAVLAPLLLVQLSTAGHIMVAMVGLPEGARTGCTVASGLLMVCFAALGGMRGTGYVQILKVGVVLAALLLVAGLVLARYDWSPAALFGAARDRSEAGGDYALPGLHFGHSAVGTLDLLSFCVTLLLGAACLPHLTMRLHPLRDARTARKAAGWAVGPIALVTISSAVDPETGGPRHSMLFALVACAVFATTLAAVAGITLAAASSLVRDCARPSGDASTVRSRAAEIRRARGGVLLVGAIAVLLAVLLEDRGRLTLISTSLAVAASVLAPILLYALFLPGFTATGARWTIRGTLPLIIVLMAASPAVSGTPIALFPERDFHWFPLQTPGLLTIPVGFLLGLVGRTRGTERGVTWTPEEASLR